MNRFLALASLAACLTLPLLAAPGTASASCQDRKVTGTVLGGVGGALIGNSISRGGGGAVIGGLGGAVLGHEIAASGCDRYPRTSYDGGRGRYRYGYRSGTPARPVRYVYYDQYGQAVSEGPAPGGVYTPAGYGDGACPSYYDSRGALVQVCAR